SPPLHASLWRLFRPNPHCPPPPPPPRRPPLQFRRDSFHPREPPAAQIEAAPRAVSTPFCDGLASLFRPSPLCPVARRSRRRFRRQSAPLFRGHRSLLSPRLLRRPHLLHDRSGCLPRYSHVEGIRRAPRSLRFHHRQSSRHSL